MESSFKSFEKETGGKEGLRDRKNTGGESKDRKSRTGERVLESLYRTRKFLEAMFSLI